jgi:hypothetical protein
MQKVDGSSRFSRFETSLEIAGVFRFLRANHALAAERPTRTVTAWVPELPGDSPAASRHSSADRVTDETMHDVGIIGAGFALVDATLTPGEGRATRSCAAGVG